MLTGVAVTVAKFDATGQTALYAVQLEQGWASPGSDPVVHSVLFIVK